MNHAGPTNEDAQRFSGAIKAVLPQVRLGFVQLILGFRSLRHGCAASAVTEMQREVGTQSNSVPRPASVASYTRPPTKNNLQKECCTAQPMCRCDTRLAKSCDRRVWSYFCASPLV